MTTGYHAVISFSCVTEYYRYEYKVRGYIHSKRIATALTHDMHTDMTYIYILVIRKRKRLAPAGGEQLGAGNILRAKSLPENAPSRGIVIFEC